MIAIRQAGSKDYSTIWQTLKPIFEAGDTYAVATNINRQEALAYWCGGGHTAFVAEQNGALLGTYYIGPNQQGGGAHVCNCGFAIPASARGKGIARKMLDHALETARAQGYRAMQFNFVVSTNLAAIKIWHEYGFETVGTLPLAFCHPQKGYVDALVMSKTL